MMMANLLRLMLIMSLTVDARRERSWWEIIPEGYRIVFSLALFLVNLLVLTIVLYLSGMAVLGGRKAVLGDAFLIAVLGTILSTVFFMFIPYRIIALLLSVVVWLLLIKRLYRTGWLGAIMIGILAIAVFLAITILLALIFGILAAILEQFLFPMFLLF